MWSLPADGVAVVITYQSVLFSEEKKGQKSIVTTALLVGVFADISQRDTAEEFIPLKLKSKPSNK